MKGAAIIPCSPELMLAWTYAFTSRYDTRLHVESNGADMNKYPNKVVCHVNKHHHIIYYTMRAPFPLNARSFLCRGVWKRIDPDTYIFVYKPVTPSDPHVPKFTPSSIKNVIPSDYECTWVIRRLRPNNFCHCTYMVRADIKGNVPAIVLNHGAANTLEKLKRAHSYFTKYNQVDYDQKTLREEMKAEEMEFDNEYGLGEEGKDITVSVSTRRASYGSIFEDAQGGT